MFWINEQHLPIGPMCGEGKFLFLEEFCLKKPGIDIAWIIAERSLRLINGLVKKIDFLERLRYRKVEHAAMSWIGGTAK